jgi:fission process protein 1
LFDKPVEEAVEWIFHKGFEVVGGKEAVGNTPATGRETALNVERKKAVKEKEL